MLAKIIIFGVVICVILWAINILDKAGRPPKDDDDDNSNGDKDTVHLKKDKDGTYRADDEE